MLSDPRKVDTVYLVQFSHPWVVVNIRNLGTKAMAITLFQKAREGMKFCGSEAEVLEKTDFLFFSPELMCVWKLLV